MLQKIYDTPTVGLDLPYAKKWVATLKRMKVWVASDVLVVLCFYSINLVLYMGHFNSLQDTRKIPTGEIATRMTPTGQFSPGKFQPRKISTRKIPTQEISIQNIPYYIVSSQGKSSLKYTNVTHSRLYYATNILHEQFSKLIKCLVIALPLNKKQGESEISEISVS